MAPRLTIAAALTAAAFAFPAAAGLAMARITVISGGERAAPVLLPVR